MRPRRRILLSLAALAVAPGAAWGQRSGALRRVGVLRAAPDDEVFRRNFEPFVPALRERGFGAGTLDILFKVRAGTREQTEALAAELIGVGVDAILAIAAPGVKAAAKVSKKIPIVAVDLESDPVAEGFASSLSRPGGNITGLFLDFPELSGNWIQQLKQALPTLSRAAVMWDPAVGTYLLKGAEQAGRQMGVTLSLHEARSPADFEAALQAATRQKAEALLALSSPVFNSARAELARLALVYRLPAIMPFPEFADAGGLLAYGPHLTSMFRQAAEVMAKVLQGTPPRDIPIERPTRFEMVVNLRTAATLGLTLPPPLLIRADRVVQ